MASEQFSLCWDNFHKNMSTGMNSLLENEDLVDVTLAVEGKYLKAHKMVLSVCSPYFRELFKVNPCKHPIVFMKDVSYVAMSDLLQFMYQGEVQVSQENLSTFIKTAEALQIKGLTGDGNGSAECDNEPEELKSVDVVEPPKLTPASRPRKTHPAPTPPAKRPRLNAPEASPTSAITKTEPSVSSTPTNDQLIQFKMEPYDQSQASITVPDDGVDETFADDPLDDTNADEGNEDYSMMEGGDDEPQAGTSTDGAAGEGQAKIGQLRVSSGRVCINGYFYRLQSVVGKKGYFCCSKSGSLRCRGRANFILGEEPKEIVVTSKHNHPKDYDEKHVLDFLKQLKMACESGFNLTMKQIYQDVAKAYPEGARLKPYTSIKSTMAKWRQKSSL
ncbi:protein tramtrack, beta isoform isoform X5 [Tribolium castaneum]|uniref:protein tramtrack, beta isoform isoform X5 n=1 Tax=Tribolium castaneum TaxID=7070 RepID=UPI00046C3647|nr:PREDICTED: protein tramtrack, beta isoform isoform X5 [Tribolium castaneum]|eukprot:XP_008198844.1 PREDICTED: protein tramtrack, beta isoform isoform X5 [Tribolium castaneum]